MIGGSKNKDRSAIGRKMRSDVFGIHLVKQHRTAGTHRKYRYCHAVKPITGRRARQGFSPTVEVCFPLRSSHAKRTQSKTKVESSAIEGAIFSFLRQRCTMLAVRMEKRRSALDSLRNIAPRKASPIHRLCMLLRVGRFQSRTPNKMKAANTWPFVKPTHMATKQYRRTLNDPIQNTSAGILLCTSLCPTFQ